MEFSRPHVINEATIEYLKTLDPQNPPNPETIAETILTVTTEKCREVNATRSKGEAKWRLPTELDEEQVARILARLYPIKRISYLDDPKADSDYILGIYQSDGENKGVYTVSDLAFKTTQQWVASTTPRSRGDNMSAKEQLIVQYNLRDYMRDYIISADPRMDFTDEQKKKTYRGLLRNKSGVSNP